ncbi:MAG: YitT family protein [Saprospiraceae bacterium]|nr:YitT family protein [Saprospiraceae bacterium]
MIPFFHSIIANAVQRANKHKPFVKLRPEVLDKKVRRVEVELSHGIRDYLSILLGVGAAAFGLRGFLMPAEFLDGGVTGTSLLLANLFDWPLPWLLVVLNLPFLYLAYVAFSPRFAFRSLVGILLLAGAVAVLPIPMMTEDKILIAAFGGLFLGLGIGLAIRGGAIIDGTEVLAITISRRSTLTVGNVILIFNLVLFIIAAKVLSIEIALYAILTYYAASKTVDFVIDGVEEYVGVTIVTDYHEQIKRMIIREMGRGVTLFRGRKGYGKKGSREEDTEIVYTVITRLETARLQTEIDKIDPDAFVIMSAVKDARGGMIKIKPVRKVGI